MNTGKRILLIHARADRASFPELADALRKAGAEVEQHLLTDNYDALLDALQGDVLPVVLKG